MFKGCRWSVHWLVAYGREHDLGHHAAEVLLVVAQVVQPGVVDEVGARRQAGGVEDDVRRLAAAEGDRGGLIGQVQAGPGPRSSRASLPTTRIGMPSTVSVWKSETETFEMRSRILWPTLAVTSELTFWDDGRRGSFGTMAPAAGSD